MDAQFQLEPKQQHLAVAITTRGLLARLVGQAKRAGIFALIVVPLAFSSAGCQPNVKGDTSSSSEGGTGGGDGGGGGGGGGDGGY